MIGLFEALARHAETAGAKTAFDDGNAPLAYAALARRVAGAAEEIRRDAGSRAVIGLLGGNRTDWVVGHLAAWYGGKTVVPLPPFFSVQQLAHVLADAGVAHIVATPDMADLASRLSVPVTVISKSEAPFAVPSAPCASVITYTSGTTGQPKGVMLRAEQVVWTARTLAAAIGARDGDRYLSALPLPLLLETIGAVIVPILAGAQVRLEPALAADFGGSGGNAIATAVAAHRPTCMVLVPQLLARWMTHLTVAGARAPDSLRFVAIGGAHVPSTLADEAWGLGIPAYEGYGLSECSSVVSVNLPGQRRAGTVGRPLSGLDVRLDEGEIVVRGPTVMDRYLHGEPAGGVWRTGDIGEFDDDGYLTVRGRRDNVLVTSLGRNISPEWIEALIAADPRIAGCVLTLDDAGHLAALLVPSDRGDTWFAGASAPAIAKVVTRCCFGVPDYAIPEQFIVLPSTAAAGLLTNSGRIKRPAARQLQAAALAGGLPGSKVVSVEHSNR
jgi:long-subunit acyl-CoA synthetase (AMP-forming)